MTDEGRVRELVRRVVYRTLGLASTVRAPAERRLLITQGDLESLRQGDEFVVPGGALVTPLARQAALDRGIRLVPAAGTGPPRCSKAPAQGPAATGEKAVAVGADHGGYALKEVLKKTLSELGFRVIDCGTHGTESVDYPDFALAVAELVAQGRAWRGVIIDGAGIGSCMAANKVPGVRAAMCYDEATAVNSRAHNDANVLTLGAGLIGPALARSIVEKWLQTPAEGGRHARRVARIMDIERRFAGRSM